MGAMEETIGDIAKRLNALGVVRVASSIATTGGGAVTLSMRVVRIGGGHEDGRMFDTFVETGLPGEAFCRLIGQIEEARK